MTKRKTPSGQGHGAFGDNGSSNSTSTESQRQAILERLQSFGSMTTLYAREVLGIMSPAPRVQELRENGHHIATHWTYETDVSGANHRQGKYVLLPRQEVANG